MKSVAFIYQMQWKEQLLRAIRIAYAVRSTNKWYYANDSIESRTYYHLILFQLTIKNYTLTFNTWVSFCVCVCDWKKGLDSISCSEYIYIWWYRARASVPLCKAAKSLMRMISFRMKIEIRRKKSQLLSNFSHCINSHYWYKWSLLTHVQNRKNLAFHWIVCGFFLLFFIQENVKLSTFVSVPLMLYMR